MLARAKHVVGRALRETGQAITVLGFQAGEDFSYQEPYTRHRTLMPIYDKIPDVEKAAFVAPSASVIGHVTMEGKSSAWYGAVLRGDSNSISVGPSTNIQDLAVIKTTAENGTSLGSHVTVGHGAVLTGCNIGDECIIGMSSVIGEGCTVESNAIVAGGAVVEAGAVVPSKQLWGGRPAAYIRDLTEKEVSNLNGHASAYCDLASEHRSSVES